MRHVCDAGEDVPWSAYDKDRAQLSDSEDKLQSAEPLTGASPLQAVKHSRKPDATQMT